MLVDCFDGGGPAKVDAGAAAHDGFAVEELPDEDGGGGGVEGDDDAAEGFQRGEGVERGMRVDEGADFVEASRVED